MARLFGFVHSGADQTPYKTYDSHYVKDITFEHPTKVLHIEKVSYVNHVECLDAARAIALKIHASCFQWRLKFFLVSW